MSQIKILFVFGCITLVAVFNNCSPMHIDPAEQEAPSVALSQIEVGTSGKIFSSQPLEQIAVGSELSFFTDEKLFDLPVRKIIWDHALNNNVYCEQTQGKTHEWVNLKCEESGRLDLLLVVEYESGIDEAYFASVEVLSEAKEPIDNEAPPMDIPVALNGEQLYAVSCAGCHGSGPQSTKRGRSAGQIQNAINSNTGGMGILSSLSAQEVAAIAAYLN